MIISNEGRFLVYCVEQYKSAKGLTGRPISKLFTKYCVWKYIYSCFETLHITLKLYLQ